MRERITFIQKLGDSLEASSLKISGGDISGPNVQAVREDRLTFALDELPSELHSLLKIPRVAHPMGFHLFFTPGNEAGAASDTLCATIRKIFGDIGESFTSLPAERFSHAAAFQYFQPLKDLSRFIHYANFPAMFIIRRLMCVKSLPSGRISNKPWEAKYRPNVRTEVGVLSAEKTPTMEAHELGIAGLLTVLGQDAKPSATMFSFASRHRDDESEFTAKFLTPTGLHPTLQIQLQSNKPPIEGAYCAPHAYFTLPRSIFVDKYQLSDGLFLASKNLTALRYISKPVDLEAPEYVMQLWGSAALIELAPPVTKKAELWTAEIPLHLRYLAPAHGGYEDVQVPFPSVFWACAAEEGTKFPTNPFERVNLGYDGLFGPRTVFWHVEPSSQSGQITAAIRVPVLDLDKAGWVNVGTAVTVLLGFAWVAWKLLSVYLKSGYGSEAVPATGKTRTSEKKRQ